MITSDQFGKLYRLRLDDAAAVAVEPLELDLGGAQGLLWAWESLYIVVNRSKEHGGSGVYRASDTDHDDRLDRVELLRRLDGEGEHGPHAILPGPDGRSLFLLAGNATDLPDPERSAVPRRWQMDSLLPPLGQTDGAWRTNRPGGWIARLDPDGRIFNLFAIGLRNPYDMAFNAAGGSFRRPCAPSAIASNGRAEWRART